MLLATYTTRRTRLMSKKMTRVYISACIGCGATQKTLYKLGEARICGQCREVLVSGEQLNLKQGGYFQRSESDPTKIIYTANGEEDRIDG